MRGMGGIGGGVAVAAPRVCACCPKRRLWEQRSGWIVIDTVVTSAERLLGWRAGAAAALALAAAAVAVGSAPWPTRPTPTGSTPAQTPAATAASPQWGALVESASGFRLRVPDGWTFNDSRVLVNRAVERLFSLSAHPLDPPAPTQTWASVREDAVVLELWQYGGPRMPSAASEESEFPLDWSAAEALSDASARQARRLQFRHVFRPLALVAHVGPSAPQRDRDQLAAIVASMQPLPVPDEGSYLGAHVAGRLANLPQGSITLVGVGRPTATPMFIVRGRQHTFAFHASAFGGYGGMYACPLRYEPDARVFICDASGARWTRVGTPLAASAQFSLDWAPVAVRDGKVMVMPSRISGPSVRDERAEFDAETIPLMRIASREAIVRRGLSLSSSGYPAVAEAKLVANADLARSGALPGFADRSDPLWAVAVSRSLPPGATGHSPGSWTLFVFDERGKLLRVACCIGDAPAGFSALPDLAPSAPAPASVVECGPTVEPPLAWDATARECVWAAYSARRPFRWMATGHTIEGDPVPSVLTYDGRTLRMTRDMRADDFSSRADRRIWEWSCGEMAKRPWSTDGMRYLFELTGCGGDSSQANAP